MEIRKAAQEANRGISKLKCSHCRAELEIKEICIDSGVITFGCSCIERPKSGHDWVTIDFHSFLSKCGT